MKSKNNLLLFLAITKVMAGERFISEPETILIEDGSEGLLKSLTKTELLVLKFISEELSSKEISDKLSVSLKTIENHRNNISRKLKLKGSNSLLKYALANKQLF